MNKVILVFLSLSAAMIWPQALASNPKEVTAAQVNGMWQSKFGEFKVWALGEQKLKIQFLGNSAGPMPNSGEGSGIASIEGNTATFKPDGVEDECKITMKFTGGKLIVTQDGICGFGFNVTAAGTYKRTSSLKPKFDRT